MLAQALQAGEMAYVTLFKGPMYYTYVLRSEKDNLLYIGRRFLKNRL